jgi:hypothetical protein
MPRSVHADRGQKEVLQWRNDTPVALARGCDLWSRWGKIMNGVADVTKRDAGQLTCEVWPILERVEVNQHVSTGRILSDRPN